MKFSCILTLVNILSWILISVQGVEPQFDIANGKAQVVSKRDDNLTHAQCAANEYGPNCTQCIPQDTCNAGHYICDNTTGSKVCLPGYYGADCLTTSEQSTIDYLVTCPENDCRNGGVCTSGLCCCGRGFAGVLCEIEIIECKNESCLNGGVCKDLVGHFECICKPPYKGNNCEIKVDAHAQTTPSHGDTCRTTLCVNGGKCFEDQYFVYCLCPTNFTGANCETDLRTKPTQVSNCPRDYYGPGCTTFCRPQNDCHGHYICDQVSGRKICFGGWHGSKCDTRYLPQSVDPECPADTGCKNDGQCIDNECCCRHNYTGEFCQIESIGCLSNPCMNNGTCYNTGNAFTCVCVGNYTGRTCDHEILPPTTTTTTTTTAPTITTTTAPTTTTVQTTTKTTTSNATTVSPHSIRPNVTTDKTSISPTSSNSYSVSHTPLNVSPVTDSSSSSDSSSTSTTHFVVSTLTKALDPSASLSTSQSSQISIVEPSSITNSNSFSAGISSISSSSVTISSTSSIQHSTSRISNSMTSLNSQTSSILSSTSFQEITPSNLLISNSGSLSASPKSSSSSAQSTVSQLPPLSTSSSTSINFPTSSSIVVSSLPSASIRPPESSHTNILSSMSKFASSLSTFETSSSTSSLTSTSDNTAGHLDKSTTLPSEQTIIISPTMALTSKDHLTKLRASLNTEPTIQSSVYLASMSVHNSHNFGVPTSTVRHTGSDVISTITSDGSAHSENGISTNWKIALIVLGGMLLLLLLIILIVILRVRQRRKDSMYVSQKPEDLQGFSKEHFSAQPNLKNPTFDVSNDSDDDSVKHDIYIVNE